MFDRVTATAADDSGQSRITRDQARRAPDPFKISRTEKYHVDRRLGFFGYYSYFQTAGSPASGD